MKIKFIIISMLLMTLLLSCLASPVLADRRGFVLDNRHNHNRQYPGPGFVTDVLPGGARMVMYNRDRYYFQGGVWYRPFARGYKVVIPPVGLIVPFLPPFYTTIWVGNLPYYYADGVYYTWRARERVYVVSDPPPEQEVVEQASLPKDLYIYPKETQSKEQQATDRYECHRWAVGETDFDPTQPSGNVASGQQVSKRTDYDRAMKACLEARNYSVQ